MNKEQILEQALRNILEGVDAPDINPIGDVEFGLHCGVEDICASNRYDGANYGYSRGVEATLEWAANEAQSALEEFANKILEKREEIDQISPKAIEELNKSYGLPQDRVFYKDGI